MLRQPRRNSTLEEFSRNCKRLGFPVPALACDCYAAFGLGNYSVFNHGFTRIPGAIISDAGQEYAGSTRGITLGTSLGTLNRFTFNSPLLASRGRLTPPGDATIVCVVTGKRKTTGAEVIAFGHWVSSASPSLNSICLGTNYHTTSTDFKVWFGVAIGSTDYTVVDSVSWGIGDRMVLVGVRRGTTITLWKNGVQVASGACGSGVINPPTTNYLQVGGLNQGAGQFNSNARFEQLLLFHHALSDAQVMKLSADAAMLMRIPDERMSSMAVLIDVPTTFAATTPPPTTEASTTYPGTTIQPTTPAPTQAPTTATPVTAVPTTPAPTTLPPVTVPPAGSVLIPNLSAQYRTVANSLHVRAWVEDASRATLAAVISHDRCTLEVLDEAGDLVAIQQGAVDPLGSEYVQFLISGIQVAAEHLYVLQVKIAMPSTGEVASGVFPMPTEG